MAKIDAKIKATVIIIDLKVINYKAEKYNQADDNVSMFGREVKRILFHGFRFKL